MKTFFLIIMAMVVLSPTFAQENQIQDKTNPDEKITVNKKYDDAGNLISYDSTYSYEWHGDTLMAFPNGGGFFSFGGTPDMDGFMKDFFSDSLHQMMPFGGKMGKEFFEKHQEFMNGMDNAFFNHFSFSPDSLNQYYRNDSNLVSPPGFGEFDFDFPDMSQFFRNFGDFGNQDQQYFNNDQQQKEWNQMMKKHQKEIEEFQKKWNSKNKDKPKADIKLHKI